MAAEPKRGPIPEGPRTETTRTVVSKDGTTIAVAMSSAGPPLILVHGTTADHFTWLRVARVLDPRFSVYGMDRRGRGQSGDSPNYALEREFEDVAAVVESIGEPVALFGHSFGGRCAMEAARLTDKIRNLIVYEPILAPDPAVLEAIEEAERFLQDGNREAALLSFLRHPAGAAMSPQEITQLQRSAVVYKQRIAAAHTIPREVRALEESPFDRKKFATITTPTLVIVGGESGPASTDGARMVEDTLPNATVVSIPGQRHAPDRTRTARSTHHRFRPGRLNSAIPSREA